MTIKIACIGIGHVGASCIYSCIHKKLADEYMLIDIQKDFVEGQALDLSDSIEQFSPEVKIEVGDYNDLHDVDYLIITAGRPQKPGETRLEMTQDNKRIMQSIAESVKKSGFSGVTIIVSNPVDIMSHVYFETTGFSKNKVIGSGCTLDTVRLRKTLRQKGYAEEVIERSFVLGEHGDSSVSIIPSLSQKQSEGISQQVRESAGEIIQKKGATYYGIGGVISTLLESLIQKKGDIYSISTYIQEHRVFISMPFLVGVEGIIEEYNLELSEEEEVFFEKSIKIVQAENS